jgi:uncharacterized Zn-finger protein
MTRWVEDANMFLGRELPAEDLDPTCHCGRQPEGDPVFGTKCPVIAHRARAGAIWRTAYIEKDREVVQLRADLQRAAAAAIDITNHHNALICPYCNPKGLKFAEPAARTEPDLTDADLAQIIEGIEHFCIGPVENAELDAIWRPYIDKLVALKDRGPGEVMSLDQLPVRIQRKRTKGWKMPPETVCVTRPSRYGNPFRVGDACDIGDGEGYVTLTAERAVRGFREWVERGGIDRTLLAILRGRNLACFCPIGSPCHADVLLELANAEAAIDITNHHNALICPYCNPKGLKFAEPAARTEPDLTDADLAQIIEGIEHELPTLPNFLRMTDGQRLPVQAVGESGLRELGAAWTDALVEHAEKRREDAK